MDDLDQLIPSSSGPRALMRLRHEKPEHGATIRPQAVYRTVLDKSSSDPRMHVPRLCRRDDLGVVGTADDDAAVIKQDEEAYAKRCEAPSEAGR